MDYTGELWIALVDSHERELVDGAWGLARLRLERASTPPDRILCDRRVESCLSGLEQRNLTPGAGRLPRRSPLLPIAEIDELEALMVLDAAHGLPRPSGIRTFGLRAGIIGRVLAGSLNVPLRAALTCGAWGILLDADPADENVRRWKRSLEAWITAGAAEVETLDDASAQRLRRDVLPEKALIRAFDAWPESEPAGPKRERIGMELPEASRAPGEDGIGIRCRDRTPLVVAVLASSQHPEANEAALRSLAKLRRDRSDLRIHWLARRGGYCGVRAAQEFRRLDLSGALHWDDEPWMRPPWRFGPAWDLLLIPEGRSMGQYAIGLSPLAMAAAASGTSVAVLAPESMEAVMREALPAGC